MKRVRLSLVVIALLIAVAAWSQTSSSPVDPVPEQNQPASLTPGAHAALFAAPESAHIGSLTKELTAGMEIPAAGPVPRVNFIDDYIFDKMKRDGIPHAPLSTDREFVRRIRLDLTGRLPSPEELREFLSDKSPDKRARLIDRLVDTPEFTDKWAYFLMDTLRVAARTRGTKFFH